MMLLFAIFLHVIALFFAAAGGFHAGKDRELDFLFWAAAIALTVIAMAVAQ